jgi:hypothetical protein
VYIKPMKGYEVLVMDENQYILRAIGWVLAKEEI